jgi:hypothetical protein
MTLRGWPRLPGMSAAPSGTFPAAKVSYDTSGELLDRVKRSHSPKQDKGKNSLRVDV